MRASLSHAIRGRERSGRPGNLYGLARGDRAVTMTQRSRRRTRLWFAVYTLILLGIAGVSIATSQWSVALTTLALVLVLSCARDDRDLFAWFTLRLWRRR